MHIISGTVCARAKMRRKKAWEKKRKRKKLKSASGWEKAQWKVEKRRGEQKTQNNKKREKRIKKMIQLNTVENWLFMKSVIKSIDDAK